MTSGILWKFFLPNCPFYGTAHDVAWTMEEYNFEELMRRRDELRDNVVVAQRKMCINKKIDDLIEFYNLL